MGNRAKLGFGDCSQGFTTQKSRRQVFLASLNLFEPGKTNKLKTLVGLANDPGSVPSIHIVALNHL